jgi:alpha-ketoglutarate-dependent taurine dioxygenase
MTELLIEAGQFPTLIQPVGSNRKTDLGLCLNQKDELREILSRQGALLLRGFAAPKISRFADFCSEFSGAALRNYRGGASPRRRIADGVYTSTEYAETLDLSLHNEMSYTYRWPSYLFFMCVVAPHKGGETPVADSRALLRQIGPDVVAEFSQKQIMYVRRLSADRNDRFSWRQAFETDGRRAVEEYCRRGAVRFRWRPNDDLELIEIRPATTTHPVTGEEVWFNQAAAFHSGGNTTARLDAFFGDGSQISEAALIKIRSAMVDETVMFQWHAGDILVLDNLLSAHGRRPFSGPRTILLAMT